MTFIPLALALLLGTAAPAPVEPDTATKCSGEVAAGRFDAALTSCRVAIVGSTDRSLLAAAARAEFEAGDAGRAATILEGLLAREWDVETARDRAMALWRAGRLPEAETALGGILQRRESLRARGDLHRLLLSLDRYEEAARTAREAARRYPASCEPGEWTGAADAALGRHREAAAAFSTAVSKGCPPFRWAGLTVVPREIGRAEYRALLDGRRLLAGIGALPEPEVLERLKLLSLVFRPAFAREVAALVERRAEHSIRLAAVGLLGLAGSEAKEAFQALLTSESFVVRKLALRQIRELGLPAFRPLLEAHLTSEETPGNRALTAVALASLLGDSEADRRVVLLQSVPEEDELRPLALRQLAEIRARRGDAPGAAALRAEADAWTPVPPPLASPAPAPASKDLTVQSPAVPPRAP